MSVVIEAVYILYNSISVVALAIMQKCDLINFVLGREFEWKSHQLK